MVVVWFSCGAASAVAAKLAIEQSAAPVRVVNIPVKEEHHDNLRFLKDIEKWLGQPIEQASNPKYPSNSVNDLWKKRGAMAFNYGAPCTYELKKQVRQRWEKEHKPQKHVLGFTHEEKGRADNFAITETDKLWPVLVENELTKGDCFRIIDEAGIKLPEMYRMGFPNANCIGCVKATSPTYWNLVRRKFPKEFKERALLSRNLDVKLVRVKNERLFLDELDPNAVGAPLKNMETECGIFCMENYAD